MQDWISHILIALIIVELFNLKLKSLVLLGSILPDFFFKISTLGLFFNIPTIDIYWILLPIHQPLGALFLTFIVMILFRFDYISTILLITIGWVTHFASDILFKTFLINTQAMLLFPFSWRSFNLNLLWGEKYYIILIITLIVYILVRLLKNYSNFSGLKLPFIKV